MVPPPQPAEYKSVPPPLPAEYKMVHPPLPAAYKMVHPLTPAVYKQVLPPLPAAHKLAHSRHHLRDPQGLSHTGLPLRAPRASDDESVGYSGHARFVRDNSPGVNVLVSDNEFGHGRSRSRSPFSHQKHRRGLEKARPRAGSPRMRPQRDFRIRPRSQSLGYRDRSPTASPEPHNRAPSVRGHGTGTGDRSQRRSRRSSSESGSGPGDVVHFRALAGGARRRVSFSPRRRRSRADAPGPHPRTPDLVVGHAPRARISPLVGRTPHLTVTMETRYFTCRA